jgi:hypothetical protein
MLGIQRGTRMETESDFSFSNWGQAPQQMLIMAVSILHIRLSSEDT